jgi:hypothetical protein
MEGGKFKMDFAIGIIVGMLLYFAFSERKKAAGTFFIDFSDPDKDVCRLELHENLNDIYAKKRIILNVKTFGDLEG